MKKFDLIVAGGGLTGVAAAVSAARQGMQALLVEQGGSLGGAISVNLVYPFMRYWTDSEDGQRKWLSAGIFTEMCQKAAVYIPCGSPTDFSPEAIKFALDDMVEQAGVTVLYHGTIFKAQTQERLVKSVSVATKAGQMDFEADFFVDATGDGDLMAFAGCDFQLGRESDGLCQPMTTCFRMADVGRLTDDKKSLNAVINAVYTALKEQGKVQNPRENVLWFRGQALGDGIAHFNTTRIVKLDPTDPFHVSRAETMARKQIWEMLEILKATGLPAFENAKIISIASSIGVRESRKLKGEHILTVDELKDCTKFPDAIALGNYDVDIHNPEGSGTSHYYFAPGTYYTIPYRSLLPKEFDNLLVGGRCISATHEAQASIRIMPICATLGQAAGLAAALAKSTGTNTHTLDVARLQALLRQSGAAID